MQTIQTALVMAIDEGCQAVRISRRQETRRSTIEQWLCKLEQAA